MSEMAIVLHGNTSHVFRHVFSPAICSIFNILGGSSDLLSRLYQVVYMVLSRISIANSLIIGWTKLLTKREEPPSFHVTFKGLIYQKLSYYWGVCLQKINGDMMIFYVDNFMRYIPHIYIYMAIWCNIWLTRLHNINVNMVNSVSADIANLDLFTHGDGLPNSKWCSQ